MRAPFKADTMSSDGEDYARPDLLLVGNFLSGGGLPRGVCEDLAIRLRGAGWAVRTTSAERGRVHRLANMLLSTWLWRSAYKVCQVDVYSGPSFVWAAAVTRLLRMVGKPFVLTLHGGRLPSFSSRWPRLVRSTLTPASVVTAPSEYLRREMKPFREDIVLLPNALDATAYPFRIRSRPRAKLVWLRAFHETYNPSLAPAVLALLTRVVPDASLTMIGPDKGDGSLERTLSVASNLGVADRMQVIPGVPKDSVGAVLSEADIFLNTTNVDNTPVSVMEAMACGLCVVSTDIGGLPDLVDHGTNGILVPAANPEAMAAGILRLLEDSDLAARLSENARCKAEQFDWSILLPQWERIFRVTALDE